MAELTHFNADGRARMVDVSGKAVTVRTAVAVGSVLMTDEARTMISQGRVAKGDVLAVAQVAGIMAAKQTGGLIPIAHPLPLAGVDMRFELKQDPSRVEISARVVTEAVTGVEMEALTAVSVAALTIYDMCKAVDKRMVMTNVHLEEKHGGKSGDFYWQPKSTAE
jgi:cyclic pyranopterin phosphate synthase